MSGSPRARIAGVGKNLPSKTLTNADLEKIVDTTDDWIITRTGIKERRIAEEGVSASDLAIPAAREALKKAGVDPKELDLIICATSTPDMMFPSTACFIQNAIGARDCAAFDILAACSGFVYGLEVANNFIMSGAAKRVLLVASEIFSQLMNWEDRSTCVLFGDGAAAAVLTPSNDNGVIESRIYADGEYAGMLSAGGFGSRRPVTQKSFEEKAFCLEMKGNQTFKIAVKRMSDVAGALLRENGLTPEDLALIVPHQANIRIINAVGKSLNVPEEKVYVNVNRYGNTSAASIPIALYEAVEEGRIKKGDLVLLVAFGGGLTWGATLMRW